MHSRIIQMYGKAAMRMKAGLTFACMNLKKLAYMLAKRATCSGATGEK